MNYYCWFHDTLFTFIYTIQTIEEPLKCARLSCKSVIKKRLDLCKVALSFQFAKLRLRFKFKCLYNELNIWRRNEWQIDRENKEWFNQCITFYRRKRILSLTFFQSSNVSQTIWIFSVGNGMLIWQFINNRLYTVI